MKYIKLYENFDFEETWIDEPIDKYNSEIDLSKIKLGKGGPKFNVLDKVIVIGKIPKLYNQIGYIIDYQDMGIYDIHLIYFINDVEGYSGYNNIPDGHGWWLNSEFLKKVE